jgi:hypothetical protein
MKRTIFLVVIICVILYFQYPYINSENNTFEILQYNNPNKSIFENMISEKKISIFTNMPIDLEYNKIDPTFFTKDFLESLKNNNNFRNIVYNNLVYYKIPLCINKKFDISFLSKSTGLKYQNNYRHLITNLKDTIKISLFYPNQKNNLYFNKKNISIIDFQNADYDKYPKLNDVKYIDVLLHKNQMISIPYKWIYIIDKYENKDSIILSYSNESIFSKLLKK